MKTGIKISPDHRTVLLFIIYLFLINRGSNSKTWMEQQGLKWSPVFISAPFKPTIEISQWNSPGRARILPVLQIHTKKRHSDVSVWSVAMELKDNPPHGCLCKPVPPLNSEERKKEKKEQETMTCEVSLSWHTFQVGLKITGFSQWALQSVRTDIFISVDVLSIYKTSKIN